MIIIGESQISTRQMLFDRELDKWYLLILKNGSLSLRKLADDYPARFDIVDINDHPTKHKIMSHVDEVTVFLRSPARRLLSAINALDKMYGTDTLYHLKFGSMPLIDWHSAPQFWSLLEFVGSNVKLNFKEISDLPLVHPDIKRLNKRLQQYNISREELDSLVYRYYTEDRIIYDNFLNRSATIEEVMEEVKHDTRFIVRAQHIRKVMWWLN